MTKRAKAALASLSRWCLTKRDRELFGPTAELVCALDELMPAFTVIRAIPGEVYVIKTPIVKGKRFEPIKSTDKVGIHYESTRDECD